VTIGLSALQSLGTTQNSKGPETPSQRPNGESRRKVICPSTPGRRTGCSYRYVAQCRSDSPQRMMALPIELITSSTDLRTT